MLKILLLIAMIVGVFFLWMVLLLGSYSENYYPDIEQL
jgi:hypothetical protein